MIMKNLENNLAELVQEVENGSFNPLEAYARLKTFEKFVKDCYTQIEHLAMEEADNYSEKTIKDFGFEITKRAGSITYDYSVNEDVRRLEVELKTIKDILKNASKMGKSILDEESGEVFEPCPAKGGVKDSLSIKRIK